MLEWTFQQTPKLHAVASSQHEHEAQSISHNQRQIMKATPTSNHINTWLTRDSMLQGPEAEDGRRGRPVLQHLARTQTAGQYAAVALGGRLRPMTTAVEQLPRRMGPAALPFLVSQPVATSVVALGLTRQGATRLA